MVGSTVTQVLMGSEGFCPPKILLDNAHSPGVQKHDFCAWHRSAAKEDIFTHQERETANLESVTHG